jgi:nucleosome binding factor SPN SPT16 subunit
MNIEPNPKPEKPAMQKAFVNEWNGIFEGIMKDFKIRN